MKKTPLIVGASIAFVLLFIALPCYITAKITSADYDKQILNIQKEAVFRGYGEWKTDIPLDGTEAIVKFKFREIEDFVVWADNETDGGKKPLKKSDK